MAFTIRRLGPGDEPVLAYIAEEALDFDLAGLSEPERPLGAVDAAAYLADPSVLHWVATDRGHIVGVGSILSVGSIGSAGSILSIGSAGSVASALSFASGRSLLSSRSCDSALGVPLGRRPQQALGAGLLALGAALLLRRQ